MITRLTLVGERELPDHLIADTRSALTHLNWLGLTEERRESRGLHVLDFRGTVPPVTFDHVGHDHDQLLADLLSGWHTLGVAAGVIRGELAATPPRLVVMDVDSTLIPVEVIEKIAAFAGVEAEVEAITSAAMRGELDFAQSLARRVAMLEGVSASVLPSIAAGIEFSPGAEALVDAVHGIGGAACVVSGGFHEVVDLLADRIGLDRAVANRLEVSGGGSGGSAGSAASGPPAASATRASGSPATSSGSPASGPPAASATRASGTPATSSGSPTFGTPAPSATMPSGLFLTGRTVGEVVDASVKERQLLEWREEFGGPVVAIGDGANDLKMLAAADLGIAYCAKPVVAAAADAAIPFPRLDAALAFMGL